MPDTPEANPRDDHQGHDRDLEEELDPTKPPADDPPGLAVGAQADPEPETPAKASGATKK